ncbi:peptidase C14, partial [Streptomyces sp. BE308]|nr:peptidase C14 [Streptomyces sp. BE308]
MLRASGLAGLVVAGSAVASGSAQAAPGHAADVTRVDTVTALRALNTQHLTEGTVVLVAGHHTPADGGAMAVRWNRTSRATHNGGTVITPAKNPTTGRWHQLHTGTVDFRTFGHFDAKTPADTALDAMVHDPTVHRIEAHTDLLFTRRHLFTRSHIELDFGGHRIHTEGIEKNTHDNPFGAVLSFRGTTTDT